MARTESKEEGLEMAGKSGEMEILLQRSQSSVMVKRDPKGVLSWEIKVYADSVGEAVINAQEAKEDLEKRLGMDK